MMIIMDMSTGQYDESEQGYDAGYTAAATFRDTASGSPTGHARHVVSDDLQGLHCQLGLQQVALVS